MLRINSVKSKEYLTKGLTKADYYMEGSDQILGQWKGEMRAILGLPAGVTVNDFESLYDNINPVNGEQITKRMRDDRKPFYDFTFSAPKSVSILWATTENLELRKSITTAFQDSVDESMSYAESQFTLGREKFNLKIQEEDKDGNILEKNKEVTTYHKTAKILYTTFLHDTSRPVNGIPDPHLHIHAGVFNMTEFEKYNQSMYKRESVYGAIEFCDFKRFADHTEAVQHSILAHKLQELGIEVMNTKNSFEVKGFDHDLIENFSTRTIEVEKYNIENDITGAKAKANTGSKTRKHKDKAKNLSELELKNIYIDRLGYQGLELVYKLSHIRQNLESFNTNQGIDSNNQQNNEQKTIKNDYLRLRNDKALIAEKASLAVDHSILHNFEKETVVTNYKLMTTALNQNLTELKLEDIKKQIQGMKREEELIESISQRKKVFTTQTIINEEQSISKLVQNSKDSTPAINSTYQLKESMSKDQDAVFYAVMQSTDSIKYIKGDAGTGKTYLIQNLKIAIEESNKKVFAYAPTSIAGRKVLREEVTTNADTVKMLLINESLQNRLNEKSVVFIDEAGMVGYQEMQKLLQIREKRGFDLILVGDTKQHASVARGDALRLMEEKAGLTPYALLDNRRQLGNIPYLEAINAFAKKDTDKAIEILDKIGAIKEVEQSTKRYQAIAKEYIDTTKKFKNWSEATKDILVVTPTHGEADIVTHKIRRELKKNKIISTKEILYPVLQDKTLSEASKQDLRNYQKGDVIQFNQNLDNGIKRGSKWEVCLGENTKQLLMKELNPATDIPSLTTQKSQENQTKVNTKELKPRKLEIPVDRTDKYQVYQKKSIKLSVGDLVKMTNNSIIGDDKQKKIYKGSSYQIKKIEETKNQGYSVTLENNWKLPVNHPHLKHGYTSTSYSSQGRTVNHLIVAQAKMSNPAASFQQGYVSASRGKVSISLYTDNKEELTKSYKRTKTREFAQNLQTQVPNNPTKNIYKQKPNL